MNSPILLQANVTLGNLGVQEVEQTKMQNPFRTAMLVEEFRFHALGFEAEAGAAPVVWANDQVSMFLGRTPLTNGFIPLGLISVMRQEITAATSNGNFILTGKGEWTWRLPKPLYVPPTEQLIMKLTNQPSAVHTITVPQTIVVGVAGHSLPANFPVPDVVTMPWATSFMSPTAVASGSFGSFTTSPTDLVNPFNVPMDVQRFTGRMLMFQTGSDGGERPMGAKVRATDSEGTIMVRDPASFTNLFYFGTNSWTVNTKLPPKGFYTFQVDQDYSQLASGPGTNPSTAFGMGMLGSWETRLR